MGNSRMQVWQRRRKITSLIVRGFTSGEIAEALGISRDTVYNDNRVIKSGDNEDLNAHCRNELNAQLYLNVKERIRELWRMFENATTESIQIRIMQELRLNDERILKRLPPLKTLAQMDKKKEVDGIIDRIIDKSKYDLTKHYDRAMPDGVVDNSKTSHCERPEGARQSHPDEIASAEPRNDADDKMKQIRETMDLLDKLNKESEAEEDNPPDPDDTKNSQ